MHSLRSRNQELNTYINSFIELNYQPVKMLGWRIIVLLLFGIFFIIKNYQNYSFSLEYWFNWSPILAIFAGILTLNFQSLYLGSMCYQYRYHDTAFQIARRFNDFEYAPLIDGVEHKLQNRKALCHRSYIILLFLLIGLLIVLISKAYFWQIFIAGDIQYITLTIYLFLVFILTLAAVLTAISIIVCKRQIELIELSLFWIKSASTLKYIG